MGLAAEEWRSCALRIIAGKSVQSGERYRVSETGPVESWECMLSLDIVLKQA